MDFMSVKKRGYFLKKLSLVNFHELSPVAIAPDFLTCRTNFERSSAIRTFFSPDICAYFFIKKLANFFMVYTELAEVLPNVNILRIYFIDIV